MFELLGEAPGSSKAPFYSLLFRNGFNNFAGKIICAGTFEHPGHLLLLFGTSVFIGLVAGIYPAFVLSGYKPVSVLKGRFVTGTRGIVLRRSLVISQFTISIALIVSTLMVYKQLRYMRSQSLGFKKDQMLIIKARGDAHIGSFMNELKSIPEVLSSCVSSGVPDGNGNGVALSVLENKNSEMQTATMEVYFVDFKFLTQYQIPVLAGRDFSLDFPTDSFEAMVINECTLKQFGYSSPKEAIGKKYSQWGSKGKIIGVIKDFHYNSLQKQIKPLSLRIQGNYFGLISLSVSSKETAATVKAVQKIWEKVIPYRPFDYYFLDYY